MSSTSTRISVSPHRHLLVVALSDSIRTHSVEGPDRHRHLLALDQLRSEVQARRRHTAGRLPAQTRPWWLILTKWGGSLLQLIAPCPNVKDVRIYESVGVVWTKGK